MLDRENSRSERWGKFSNFLRDSIIDRLFRREIKVVVVEVSPSFCGHCHSFSENGLSAFIIENGGVNNCLCSIGGGSLNDAAFGSVNHKNSVGADFSVFCTQVGYNAYRGNY